MQLRSLVAAAAAVVIAGTGLLAGSESAQALPRSASCTGALIDYYYDIAMFHTFDGRVAIDLAQNNYPQANNDSDAAIVWAQRRDAMATRLLNAGCF